VGECKIAAFTVVNAMGAIVNREGKVVRGLLDPNTGERYTPIEAIERTIANADEAPPTAGNTTLTVVITNQKLSSRSLNQFARQVHSSMARAIQPFHTINDGDILYAVSTNEVNYPHVDEVALGVVASEVLWDAVLSIVTTP
jgi:L-aminopeptidase/D-esterase-like protein